MLNKSSLIKFIKNIFIIQISTNSLPIENRWVEFLKNSDYGTDKKALFSTR